jgi:hypothetical protein
MNAYFSFLNSPAFPYVMAALTIWDLFWRGKALWRAAKNNSLYWFIALLVVNSLGILPIIYIYFFSKKKK